MPKPPMQESTITVKSKKVFPSGAIKITSTTGLEFMLNQKNAASYPEFSEGDQISVVFVAEATVYKGQDQITRWVNALKPAQDAPVSVPTIKPIPAAPEPKKWPVPVESRPSGNGSKYSDADLRAFERKDRMMARECAYKCAAQDVTAFVEAGVSARIFESMNAEQIKTLLSARRSAVYMEVLEGITGDKLETQEIEWEG